MLTTEAAVKWMNGRTTAFSQPSPQPVSQHCMLAQSGSKQTGIQILHKHFQKNLKKINKQTMQRGCVSDSTWEKANTQSFGKNIGNSLHSWSFMNFWFRTGNSRFKMLKIYPMRGYIASHWRKAPQTCLASRVQKDPGNLLHNQILTLAFVHLQLLYFVGLCTQGPQLKIRLLLPGFSY